MATSSSSADIPFSVHGFVTDPKLVGYQVLTNYESTYWRALVGKDPWSLYEVLRSFCHQGENTCHPSINLLMAILGLKQRWVLTGGITKVKGKEYRYPGLIEVLQEYKLMIAEVVGEGPMMRYVFHVNLTPGLLTDEQLRRLPAVLQRKHVELLERCQQRQRELETKRRPPKVTVSKTAPTPKAQEGGSHNLLEGGLTNCETPLTNCERGSHNLLVEQHPLNTTQRTTSSATIANNNNSGGQPSPTSAVVVAFSAPLQPEVLEAFPHQTDTEPPCALPTSSPTKAPTPLDPPSPTAAEQALVAIGIGKTVAQRLATRYSSERIAEKIEYLAFLQAERADTVQNPRGWLRKAIEEDYGVPDGFVTAAERERREAEAVEEAQRAAAAEEHHQAFAAQVQERQEARRRQLQEQYGTTEADYHLWEEVLTFAKYGQQGLYDLYARAQILRCTDETVLLGFEHEGILRKLDHPGTMAALKRHLKLIAKRPLEVETVLLSIEALGYTGEDGAASPTA